MSYPKGTLPLRTAKRDQYVVVWWGDTHNMLGPFGTQKAATDAIRENVSTDFENDASGGIGDLGTNEDYAAPYSILRLVKSVKPVPVVSYRMRLRAVTALDIPGPRPTHTSGTNTGSGT